MTQRERTLAVAILTVVILGGGAFVGYHFFFLPFRQKENTLLSLRKDVDSKRLRLAEIERDRPKLEMWRQLSLPPDVNRAHEYVSLLNDLLLKSGFTSDAITRIDTRPADTRSSPTLPGRKEPIYTILNFNVVARGSLSNLVALLENFYRTGLLHRIKTISVQRPLTTTTGQRPNQLDISLTIEGLIVQGGEERPQLLPSIDRRLLAIEAAVGRFGAPSGLSYVLTAAGPAGPQGPRALAEPHRQYASIADKDIFYGPLPPPPTQIVKKKEESATPIDVAQFVFLTDITQVDAKVEAHLYDRYNNSRTKLRTGTGADSFRIRDAQGATIVQGKVVRIDDRDVIFQVGTKVYTIHVGQSLKEAMAKTTKEVMEPVKAMKDAKDAKAVQEPKENREAEPGPSPREAPQLPEGR